MATNYRIDEYDKTLIIDGAGYSDRIGGRLAAKAIIELVDRSIVRVWSP